jgi:nitrite reductase/ring-hydroxylating ferredoxin subunit
MAFERVASTTELADGDIKAISAGGRQLILCRSGDEYFALQRRCLHQGADLADGVIWRGTIVCSVHAWRFDLRTGHHEIAPDTCLRTYPLRIDGDAIWVDGAGRGAR